MKRVLAVPILLTCLLVLVGAFLLNASLRPAAPAGAPVWFQVETGMTLREVAARLEDHGLIRNATAFVWFGRLTGVAHRVQAGRYQLTPRESAVWVLRRLVQGDTIPFRITLPEGIWLTEFASVVAESLAIEPETLVTAAADPSLLSKYGISAESLEGYLFPATYEFSGNEGPRTVLEKLVEHGRSLRSGRLGERADSLGLSWHQILTLASIIEAETARDDERPKVSAVYHQRLKRGMKLQADPTLIYALGERGRALTYEDLEIESPYNTYRCYGLPPGPIGNPGLAAIEAALYPDSSCRSLYFFAKGDGTHIFSDTFQEHASRRKRRP